MQRLINGDLVEVSAGLSFYPSGAAQNPPTAGAALAVTAAVQQISLPATLTRAATVRIANYGTQPIAFAYGTAAGLTMANGVFMLAGTVETFYLPAGTSKLSLIAPGPGSTVYVSVGDAQ
ncbi:hypothetical protein [Cupriavidus malaysiensis]|uniref:hypothetical protein n=1 Tax=Cupriavidus malaysiensis TaxID=367825 RepID=UPI0012FFC4EA|nr:hypothetical protein [Cupriavidus malaysiensis]